MVIVDPPSIFWGMWNMVKALMPLKTQQKVGSRLEGLGSLLDAKKMPCIP